ncbi:SUN5 protein, partial [Nyctiprogne leucopyga]|nr:SUN5 protein [Nyctiprogne leucopyga]
VSPGNCWAMAGQRGQVVIRLPARVHVTAITVQHIYEEASPSGTVSSAPGDIDVFVSLCWVLGSGPGGKPWQGLACFLDADGEEETLLGTFTYNIAEEAIQTFPLKVQPLPRAFSYIRFVVKSNWGNPEYTCIYRVQVHGKRA